MMLVLETTEEEKAIRQGTVTSTELGTLIRENNLSSKITVAVNTGSVSRPS